MLKSSLLEIIRTFSKQELIKFDDFVRSPYFNKKENVINLFVEIRKYATDFNDVNLEKEKVWVKIFPGKEYNYGIMKNLIHDLTKLCESFITIEISKNDKLRNNIDLMESLLMQRQLTKVFSSRTKMLEKIYDNPDLKKEDYGTENYYEFLDKLNYFKSQYNWQHNMRSMAAYEFTCRSADYLLYSAIICFYKRYNNYLSHNDAKTWSNDNTIEIFREGLNKNIIPSLLKNLKIKSERDYRILKCYHDMNVAINTDADINSYVSFKKSLNDCSGIIPKIDLKNLRICLANSLRAIREVNFGIGLNFNKEILENYDFMIENNIFLESNGVMEGNLFMIYILAAFSCKEFESIEILTKKFGNKIPEDRRENDNNYSLALICFGKKEYSKSLEHLSKINYDFFNMKHLVKNIQMMNYYELNDYISFNYVADLYRHFLSKNKSVTSYNKSVSEGLCNNVNKLFKLRESFDKFELEKFRKEIKENEPMYKLWILDKIPEIEKNS